MKLDRQTVRNIGLSHARNQLSNRGWTVMPSARNTKGVDFLVYGQDASRTLTIKVRAFSRRNAVSLGATPDNFLADYLLVCSKVIEDNPEWFILTQEDARGS